MKTILSVVAILSLLAPSAMARQWTSRDGGFSVEAEFVELKDGNVMLRQKDGTLLRVSLAKLSLPDVDYINHLSGPTASPSPSPPPAAVQSQPANGAAVGAEGRMETDVSGTLAELQSADVDRIRRRLKLLAESRPTRPNPAVAGALAALLADSGNVSAAIRTDAATAMITWSTADSVPVLTGVLNEEKSPAIRRAVIEALTPYKSKSAIAPIAQLLSDTALRHEAGKVLMAVGSAAEDAVLQQMEGADAWTRLEACEVLAVIGTKKSISALDSAAKDPSWLATRTAEKAVEAVKLREHVKPKTD